MMSCTSWIRFELYTYILSVNSREILFNILFKQSGYLLVVLNILTETK